MSARSQNGWPANDINRTGIWPIPGTDRKVRLEKGDAGYVLTDFAAWFDKHVESVDGGILDDWGYAERPIRGSSTTLSNHASGTALDLNAPRHPLGARGTFTPAQAAAIRTKLRDYDGVIRWGGDYRTRADEMHFEIDAPAGHVKAVADRIRRPQPAPTRTQKVKRSVKRRAQAAVRRGPLPRTLKPGSRGKDVALLQRFLGITDDGIFGPATADAVLGWKRMRGWKPSPRVGGRARRTIVKALGL